MEHDEQMSPWIHGDLEKWKPLIVHNTPVLYKKDEVIFHQGNPHTNFFIVHSGRVRITTYDSNGNEKQLYIANQGTLFGEASCMTQRPHSATAIAIIPSYIHMVSAKLAEEVMKDNWDVTCLVLRNLSRKKYILFQQVVELSFSDSLQRITQMLINLGRAYGESVPEGILISIRFIHQDVANLTNTSRVTVSNTMSLLLKEGYIAKQNGHYILKNLEILHDLAAGKSILETT